MQKNKVNQFVQWWMTPEFPLIHLSDKTNIIKKWFFHPIKRRLAKWYLLFLQRFTNIKVVGITGSAGKTTTKEMLAAICKYNGKTVYSVANIDPVYNIPTTILQTPIGTKYLILEMGIEYPGEMDFYLWLAKPDVGVVTNIFPTHLEFLKSVNGVFLEKSKLVLGLSKKGTAVLNSDDSLLKSLGLKIISKIAWFNTTGDPIYRNASAAKAAALSLGISEEAIAKGLTNYKNPKHRLTLIQHKSDAKIFDDSYNSNPKALSETLKYFVKIAGKNNKIAVLGDMKELGEFEERLHREIGREISKLNFDAVIGVGGSIKYLLDEVGKNTKTYFVSNQEEAMPILKPFLQKENYILIKGSRSIGLDKLVDKLT